MEYICRDGNVILTEYDSFVISQSLECGQCFRFEKLGDENYLVIAYNKLLRIYKDNDFIVFENTTQEDFENIWKHYFDFERDYIKIKNKLSQEDLTLKKAIEYAPGIRIFNQEFFECFISFIISQNNRIPMIKKVIENISIKYGNYLGKVNDKDYYSFPTVEQLAKADEEGLKECKTGFRAKYIIDAIDNILSGKINEKLFSDMSTEKLRELLINVKGVGPKVSDCVLLFSCGRSEAFPTDVWVKRVMSHFYFDGNDTPIKQIHEFAYKKFGDFAGFAQQYLFNYAREQKIGA